MKAGAPPPRKGHWMTVRCLLLGWDSSSLNRKSGRLWAAAIEKVNLFSLPLVMAVRQLSGDVMDQSPGCWEWILCLGHRLWISALCISRGFAQQEKRIQQLGAEGLRWDKETSAFHKWARRSLPLAEPIQSSWRISDYREQKNSKCRGSKREREKHSGKQISISKKIQAQEFKMFLNIYRTLRTVSSTHIWIILLFRSDNF